MSTYTGKRKRSSSSSRSGPKPKLRRNNAMPYIPRSVLNTPATGRVPANKTDLALQKGPFSPTKYVSFEYLNELTAMGGATNFTTLSVGCNDLYDFDKNGVFGNKQPLYFDSLLSASGPYKNYKVHSWETTYTIVNNTTSVPISVWAFPGVISATEIDSAAEADNYPGVKVLYLTGKEGSKSTATLTVKGNIKDCWNSWSQDVGVWGSYNGSPACIAFGGLCIKGSDGSTAPSVYVAVRHIMYTQLSTIDSLVS